MILDKIVKHKVVELERAKRENPLELISSRLERMSSPLDFYGAVKPNGTPKIIAEVKQASPSKGILRNNFSPEEIARGYERAGASAVSVLTDREFFKGDLVHLRRVKESVGIPVLRKDFIIDPYQVYEARLYGADAVLLIAAILDRKKMEELLGLVRSLGMSALVEVHDEWELEKALAAGSDIIGINNRDLKTFDVSLDVSIRISKLVPQGKVVVAESGIGSTRDLKRLIDEGIYVFLIGEAFMRASDPGEMLRKMLLEFR
jgi:indole-3-glycerol phosphate synthase